MVVPEKRATGHVIAIQEPYGSGLDVQEVASLVRDLVSARSYPQQHLGPGLVRAAGQRMDGQREEVAALPSRLPVPVVRSTQRPWPPGRGRCRIRGRVPPPLPSRAPSSPRRGSGRPAPNGDPALDG